MTAVTFHTTLIGTGPNTAGIRIPDEVVAALGAGKRPPVWVTVNGYRYRNTLAVMGGETWVGVSSAHRTASGLAPGDAIEVTLELDAEPRTVEVPADLAAALDAEPAARATFEGLSPSLKKYHVDNVEGAKSPETRTRRIEKAVATLKEGRAR
ncbi:MAG: YdeI/OmpD-associated family protein [Chloroflexota bacterium]